MLRRPGLQHRGLRMDEGGTGESGELFAKTRELGLGVGPLPWCQAWDASALVSLAHGHSPPASQVGLSSASASQVPSP